MTMMMRVGASRVAWWELALSAVLMVASLYFALKLSAKLFRLGTLMYGNRPSLVEIIRWLKAA